MVGEAAIVGIIEAVIVNRKTDRWARLILSCGASGFCTFTGVTGAGLLSHLSSGQRPGLALAFAVGEGLIASSAIVWRLWYKSELTKGMQIMVPTSVANAEQQILEQGGISTVTPRGKQ